MKKNWKKQRQEDRINDSKLESEVAQQKLDSSTLGYVSKRLVRKATISNQPPFVGPPLDRTPPEEEQDDYHEKTETTPLNTKLN